MNDGIDWEEMVFACTTEAQEIRVRQAFRELCESMEAGSDYEIPETLQGVLQDSLLARILQQYMSFCSPRLAV
ncbi:MAG: hypothetical protein JWL80_495 [Parcubacteria group bacterium]|nr:hypothetical protein [Parcubacteria group bacterium]